MSQTPSQCVVIVSDSGESWALNGDSAHHDEQQEILPKLLADGWQVQSVSPGSGAKDDVSYWLVVLGR